MADKLTIKDRFQKMDSDRSAFLERARDFAALTIPESLPPAGQDQYDELPSAWRNIGGVGIENMVSRTLTSLFPVGISWFRIAPSAELKANESLSTDQKNQFIALLYQRELIVASKLEATNYRLAARSALESIFILGNSLTRFGNDYDTRFYRLDNWVVRRSGTGKIIATILREKKHPSELSEEDRATAKVKAGEDEEQELYTLAEVSGSEWVVRQEMNGKVLREETSDENPFDCCTYRLCPGEHYARGFVSTRYPDLKSVNYLWQALNFGMANAAKMVPVVDPSEANIRPADLTKNNGEPIIGRVVSGQVQGVAFLQTQKAQDMGIALQGAQYLEESLGRSMLVESESMPKGERVTAYAVSRIAQELEGALGGAYAHIADSLQRPLVEKTIRQLERSRVLAPLPDAARAAQSVEILTGSSALSRSLELNRLLEVLQQVAMLPGGLDHINLDVVVDRIFQYRGVDTTGMLKTPEQIAAAMQQRMQEAVLPEAGKQAVKSIGKIIEQRAAQGAAMQ